MLLRYSGHLADGRGIVWNVGEKPVDGATDFLFMVVVAAVHETGVGLEHAAQGVGLLAHAFTVLLVFFAARRLFAASPGVALLSAVFLALGPGLRHLAACYGTPLFALACGVTFAGAVVLAEAPADRVSRAALAFSLAGLVAGLARPEGVFFAVFCLGAVLHARRGASSGLILGRFLAVFLTLGLAYFLWRFWYFGYPLPNPFYKKGAGLLYGHSLRQSWRNLFSLALPFVVVLAARRPSSREPARRSLDPHSRGGLRLPLRPHLGRDELRDALPLSGPARDPHRCGGRSGRGPSLLLPREGREPWPPSRPSLSILGLAGFQHWRYQHVEPRRMGLYDAARVLQEYSRYNYALVTTEAGLLPLYSTWRAVDAWGLNDAFIAHHGEVTTEYLDRYRPEVIVFHAYFSPGTPESGPRVERRSLGPAWHRMVTTLKEYAEGNGYVLAAVFGRNAYDTHYYYVRSGFARSREIADRIRALDYQWDGEPTLDFAAPR